MMITHTDIEQQIATLLRQFNLTAAAHIWNQFASNPTIFATPADPIVANPGGDNQKPRGPLATRARWRRVFVHAFVLAGGAKES